MHSFTKKLEFLRDKNINFLEVLLNRLKKAYILRMFAR